MYLAGAVHLNFDHWYKTTKQIMILKNWIKKLIDFVFIVNTSAFISCYGIYEIAKKTS